MNRITLTVIVLLVLGTVGYFWYANLSTETEYADAEKPLPLGMEPVSRSAVSGEAAQEELLPTDISTILDPSKSVPLDTIPASLTVLVNRAFLLPPEYEPEHLTIPKVKFETTLDWDKNKLRDVAATALEDLFKSAKKEKIKLVGISGYRSYKRQREVYEKSAKEHGKAHADKYCALPGSSEHQTGLAIDVSTEEYGNSLDAGFGETREGKWLADNAYRFGFVIRYPKGKSKITGYNYEPWHLRYIGKKLSKYLYKNNLTLEEYYNVSMNKENKDWRNDL